MKRWMLIIYQLFNHFFQSPPIGRMPGIKRATVHMLHLRQYGKRRKHKIKKSLFCCFTVRLAPATPATRLQPFLHPVIRWHRDVIPFPSQQDQ